MTPEKEARELPEHVGRSIAHSVTGYNICFYSEAKSYLFQVCVSKGLSFAGKPEWRLVNLKATHFHNLFLLRTYWKMEKPESLPPCVVH